MTLPLLAAASSICAAVLHAVNGQPTWTAVCATVALVAAAMAV